MSVHKPETCDEQWILNRVITCNKEPHERNERHRGKVTKVEIVDYGTAMVRSETTDTVEWDDPMIGITRSLDRAAKKEKSDG